MFCTKCGSPNDTGSSFCVKCGAILQEAPHGNSAVSTGPEICLYKAASLSSKSNRWVVLLSVLIAILSWVILGIVLGLLSSLSNPYESEESKAQTPEVILLLVLCIAALLLVIFAVTKIRKKRSASMKYALTITSKNVFLVVNGEKLAIPLADVMVVASHKAIEGNMPTDYIQISSKTGTVIIPYLLENEKIVSTVLQAKQNFKTTY